MAKKSKEKDSSPWEDFYDDVDSGVKAGIGTIDYSLYSSDAYQAKKKKTIIIGGLARIVYPAFFVDSQPTILIMKAEPQYHTILALNTRYIPPKMKTALFDYILKSNSLRIRAKKPLIIDYQQLKRPFPWVAKIVRRYKLALVGVVENVPMIGWPSVAAESSKYSTVWRSDKQ